MKNLINKFLMIAIFASVAILFTNCKDENNPTSSPELDANLVGKWELEEIYIPSLDSTANPQNLGFSITVNFMTDGKFEIAETETGSMPSIDNGTWSTTGGTLTLNFTDDEEEDIIPYTITGDVGIMKVNYEVSPGIEVPADFKFRKQAANTNPPVLDDNLVGNWELTEVYVPLVDSTVFPQDLGFSLTANFMADGKYEITDTETGGTPEIETGTWSATGGTLALKNSDDGLVESIPYTVTGNVGVLKVNYEVSPGFEVPAEFKFMKQ